MDASLLCKLAVQSMQVVMQMMLLPTLKRGSGGEFSCQDGRFPVPGQCDVKINNSRFFLLSMDSIFDLIFESASVHNLLESEESISKLNKTVTMTSLIDLNPLGKRDRFQPIVPATVHGQYSWILGKSCEKSPVSYLGIPWSRLGVCSVLRARLGSWCPGGWLWQPVDKQLTNS